MVEVSIDSIRVSLINQQRIVMLKQIDGDAQLPIWIGPCEAESIAVELHETEMARPLTHDLINTVIERLNAAITQIVISRLQNDIFHAELHLKAGDETIVIDARPSDSLAIAVRAKVPIYVSDEVLSEAGIRPEPDISTGEENTESAETPEAPEELDAFKDFLDNLDLGDL